METQEQRIARLKKTPTKAARAILKSIKLDKAIAESDKEIFTALPEKAV